MKKTPKLLLLILMILLLLGCAVTNFEIQTPYKPTLQKINGCEKYSAFTKVNYEPVFQEDPKAVGVKKGGAGFEMSRVYLYENVDEWIKKGFDQELKMAGFDVVNKPGNKTISITLNVKQLFVEPWVGFWSCDVIGILKIEAQVELPNKNSYYVRKFVTYDTLTTIAWPDFTYETRILNVSQKNIPAIVKEICTLLTRNS